MFNPELLAANLFSKNGEFPFELLIALVVFVSFIGIVIFAAKRYKRCPSNRVLVVYGKIRGDRSSACIHGGGRFVLPIIQDYGYLNLEPIQIEVPLRDALSIENIRVNVPSVFTVAISVEQGVMQNAAVRLLGLNTPQIKKQAEDIIFGQLRQVIASMQIEDINRDREKFLHNIQSSVEPELRKIGMVLINVNITDITDESGYIEAIGRKAASEAIQKARGDVAEQEKIGEIRVAEADRDKMVQVADAQKVREIGIHTANREKAVRIADLDKEQQVGEQRAGFAREIDVADAEREKRVSVADANAIAYTGEAGAQAKIAAAQAQLQVKKAEAYQVGETSKREAEAAVLEAQNIAMAKAALAEAEKIEAERRAELEAPAKAQKAKVIVDAQAEAEKRKLEAEGQAAAIYAKLEAEAKGQYEILAKKGDGLKKIVEACGGSQEAFQLLMLEHFDTLAETAAKAISNIKFDKVIVWENGSQNGKSATANFLQGMTHSLPPMLQVMKDIGGVEMPEVLGRLMPETNGDGLAAEKPSSTKESTEETPAPADPPETAPRPAPQAARKTRPPKPEKG